MLLSPPDGTIATPFSSGSLTRATARARTKLRTMPEFGAGCAAVPRLWKALSDTLRAPQSPLCLCFGHVVSHLLNHFTSNLKVGYQGDQPNPPRFTSVNLGGLARMLHLDCNQRLTPHSLTHCWSIPTSDSLMKVQLWSSPASAALSPE